MGDKRLQRILRILSYEQHLCVVRCCSSAMESANNSKIKTKIGGRVHNRTRSGVLK